MFNDYISISYVSVFFNSVQKIFISLQIYLGLQIYPQYKYYVKNLRKQITQREKYLKNINDNELHIELACDQDKFIAIK